MAKRLIDITLSALALLLTLPVLIICCFLVWLNSGSPIFFTQSRVGHNGRLFNIIKLRTMNSSGSTNQSTITVSGDPRITSVGLFLRRYKIDEIPQLINVLKGEMSLVGPRPEVPEYVSTYPSELKDKVLSVRPGLTDLATLKFTNEEELLKSYPDPIAAYRQVILPEKLAMNAEYVNSRSIIGDLIIIYKTALKILRLAI